MTNKCISLSTLLIVTAVFSCNESRPDNEADDVYVETPYPDELEFFCQWNRFGGGMGEPIPVGPSGTTAHEERAGFPVPESGSCADIGPGEVDQAIIRKAEEKCDAPIEGIERGCYRIFDADSDPECVFFAYYFSSCEPIQVDE